MSCPALQWLPEIVISGRRQEAQAASASLSLAVSAHPPFTGFPRPQATLVQAVMKVAFETQTFKLPLSAARARQWTVIQSLTQPAGLEPYLNTQMLECSVVLSGLQ